MGRHILAVALLCFAFSLILIKVVDVLFHIPGNSLTVIRGISAGEVLSYLGGVLAAIATGILSYLVYRKEKREITIEEEKVKPALFVTGFGGVEAKVRLVQPTPLNTVVSLMTDNPPQFSYGVYLDDSTDSGSGTKCARQYNFKFKFSGEIRCKRIIIDKIEFISTDKSKLSNSFLLQGEKSIFDAFENGNEYNLTLYCSYCKKEEMSEEMPWGSIKLYFRLQSLIGEEYSQTILVRKHFVGQYEFEGNIYSKAELLQSVEYDM